MKDQAELLRQLMATPGASRPSPRPSVPILVVGSGKGGVGKSLVAIGIARAHAGAHRVLLLEGDQNLGTLHIMLGVRPAGRLEDLLDGGTPEALLTPVAEGLWLLPGDSGAEALYALGPMDRARLHHRLSTLFDRFDAVVVDGGPGIDSVVRVAAMGASGLVVVTTPEPAALIDAYALIKIMHIQVPGLPVDVLVNRAADANEGLEVFERLDTACERFLSHPARFLGWVPEDGALRDAARGGVLPTDGAANGPAGRAIREAAYRLFLPLGDARPEPALASP